MSKNETSQVQHEERFTRMTQDAIARMQAFYDELARFESKAYTLATDTFTYFTDLAAEWRKATLDATRKGAEMFTKAKA
jgi:hypothetical protein